MGGQTCHSWEVDRNGNQIGPSTATGLTICALDRNRCCCLLRFGKQMQMVLVLIDWRQDPEREQRVRDLFAREGIVPVHDARAEREAILHYPLPESEQRIAWLCSQVLASGYGISDDEPLQFTLIQYPLLPGEPGGGLLESSPGVGPSGPVFGRVHVDVRDPTHPPVRTGRLAGHVCRLRHRCRG